MRRSDENLINPSSPSSSPLSGRTQRPLSYGGGNNVSPTYPLPLRSALPNEFWAYGRVKSPAGPEWVGTAQRATTQE
jgi:hypothetical protein